jgi:hypothetical protein
VRPPWPVLLNHEIANTGPNILEAVLQGFSTIRYRLDRQELPLGRGYLGFNPAKCSLRRLPHRVLLPAEAVIASAERVMVTAELVISPAELMILSAEAKFLPVEQVLVPAEAVIAVAEGVSLSFIR